jgi:hypothetical protein
VDVAQRDVDLLGEDLGVPLAVVHDLGDGDALEHALEQLERRRRRAVELKKRGGG